MRAWLIGALVAGAVVASGSTLAVAAESPLPVGSIQRFRFVGASEDGRRVAILLSHFGPSSQAPFVNLQVKESGKHDPLWQDNRFLMEGGEEELKYLEGYILKEYHSKLADFGIKTDRHAHQVTAQWSTESAKSGLVTRGNLDTRHRTTFAPFSIAEEEVTGCSEKQKGKRWRLCAGSEACVSLRSGDDCYTKEIVLRDIVRTKETYWFVVNRKVPVLNALNAYVVDVMGTDLKSRK